VAWVRRTEVERRDRLIKQLEGVISEQAKNFEHPLCYPPIFAEAMKKSGNYTDEQIAKATILEEIRFTYPGTDKHQRLMHLDKFIGRTLLIEKDSIMAAVQSEKRLRECEKAMAERDKYIAHLQTSLADFGGQNPGALRVLDSPSDALVPELLNKPTNII
jgi:hypothetical protein